MYNCPKWRQEVGPCIRQSLCMNTPEKSTQQLPSAIGTAWEDTAVSSAGDSTDPSRALTLEGGSCPCTGTSKIKIKFKIKVQQAGLLKTHIYLQLTLLFYFV